jgi:hypothetical protein
MSTQKEVHYRPFRPLHNTHRTKPLAIARHSLYNHVLA